MRNAKSAADGLRTAYSSDAVYLYSTHDDPSDEALGKDTLIASNHTSPERSSRSSPVRSFTNDPTVIHSTNLEMEEDIERMMTEDAGEDDRSVDDRMDEDADEEHNGDDETDDGSGSVSWTEDTPATKTSTVPIVYPRARFSGACNVETVKDGVWCVLLFSRMRCSACLQLIFLVLEMSMSSPGQTTATSSSGEKTRVNCMTSWKEMAALSTSSRGIHSYLSLL